MLISSGKKCHCHFGSCPQGICWTNEHQVTHYLKLHFLLYISERIFEPLPKSLCLFCMGKIHAGGTFEWWTLATCVSSSWKHAGTLIMFLFFTFLCKLVWKLWMYKNSFKHTLNCSTHVATVPIKGPPPLFLTLQDRSFSGTPLSHKNVDVIGRRGYIVAAAEDEWHFAKFIPCCGWSFLLARIAAISGWHRTTDIN